jgi:hypothetical protein
MAGGGEQQSNQATKKSGRRLLATKKHIRHKMGESRVLEHGHYRESRLIKADQGWVMNEL